MKTICLLITGCLAIVFTASTVSSAQTQRRKIIDVHLHARHFNDYGDPPAPNPVTGVVPNWKNDKEVVEKTLSSLRKWNIQFAVVSGGLDLVSQFETADPARFIPSLEFLFADPPLPDTSEFIALFRQGKFKVFGELGLQYQGKSLADSQMGPYLRICERLKIPVALHTGLAPPNTPYQCCPKFRTHLGNPALIEEVLIKFPNLRIQLMHMGYPYLAETKAIMMVYPQVYADMAIINWALPKKEFYNYLGSLIDAGLEDRLMYGSDQMGWLDAIPLSIANVETAAFLTEKQKLFFDNAATFYNLKK